MNKQFNRWLEKAYKDISTAKLLLDNQGFPEAICFHCQQAVEKALKGFIQNNDILPEKIYNLYLLCKQANTIKNVFSQLFDDCKKLTDYYIENRYPVDWDCLITRYEA